MSVLALRVKLLVRCLALVVLLASLGQLAAPPLPIRANGVFVVNSAGDAIAYDSVLTLREAMAAANGYTTGPFTDAEKAQISGCDWTPAAPWYIVGSCGAGWPDEISFVASLQRITLSSTLPTLTDTRTWIHGNGGYPIIDGGGMSVAGHAFIVNGSAIFITGLSIVNVAPGAPDQYADISLGPDAVGVRLAYNYVGTQPGASSCTPSGVTRNAAYGVAVVYNTRGSPGTDNGVAYIYGNTIGCHTVAGVMNAADYVYIGVEPDGVTVNANLIGLNSNDVVLGNGTSADINAAGIYLEGGLGYVRWNLIRGNVISHNQGDGIRLNNVRNVTVWDNRIGVTQSAVASAGNAAAGLHLLDGCQSILVRGNLISGNGSHGVWIQDSSYNVVQANYIGINGAGAAAIGNSQYGVFISGALLGAHDNTVGGTTVDLRNVISGNGSDGVHIQSSAEDNNVAGNLIGLNAAGDRAIPNRGSGVYVGSDSNTIGTSALGERQFIAGNQGYGIEVKNANYTFIGQANRIGVATDEISALGNGAAGVRLAETVRSVVRAYIIAYNGDAGVVVEGATSPDNMIWLDVVMNNGGLPIDLGHDGHTPNGSRLPPGPNRWLAYPVITSATGNVLRGTACPLCLVRAYRALGNPAAPFGGGESFLPDVSVVADATGNWTLTLPVGHGRTDVSLVAYKGPCTIASGCDTSEMSPRPMLWIPITVKQ